MGELRCGGVAVWGSCGVAELRGVGELWRVWESWCGVVAVCEGPSGYHTLDHCVLGVSLVFRVYREKLII